MTHIGIISDTHGLIPEKAATLFSGVSTIVHAGDIGGLQVLAFLSAIAPVISVRGNYDHEPNLQHLLLPDPSPLVVAGLPTFLTHRMFTMGWAEHSRLYALGLSALSPRPRLVIFGHTHMPVLEEHSGMWFVNPGYAGPDPLEGPRTVALLDIDGRSVHGSIIPLD